MYKDDPEESPDEEEGGNGAPTLPRLEHIKSRGSFVEPSKPRAQYSIIVLEEALVLGEFVISVVALETHTWGKRADIAALAGVAFWAYLFVLGLSRLLFAHTLQSRYPNLWYHSSSLYAIQWIVVVLRFRSAQLDAPSQLASRLIISDFCLSTVLALVAITARKGNKVVPLEYEGDLPPAREPLANVFSTYTFGWADQIVWQGFRKPLELPDVWNLAAKDKAAAVLADFRQLQKTSRLALHLLKYFRKLLLIQATWSIIAGFLTFVPTLLLKAFLEYVENPEGIPVNAAWLYITLLAVSTCVKSIVDGQALWVGRKICIRLRAVIVGEIYAKALRRKAATTKDSVLGSTEKKIITPPQSKHKSEDVRPTVGNRNISMLKSALSSRSTALQTNANERHQNGDGDGGKEGQNANATTNTSVEGTDAQANVGTIINLMSVDSYKVSEISAYLHFVWGQTPVQLVLSVVLLYQILGWSAVASIIMMVLVMPLNMWLAKQFQRKQKNVMAGTDVRIHTTNEILQNIRIIKYFAWERHFGRIVDEKRTTELKALRNKYILWAFAATVWFSVPILITFLSFLLYTVVEKRPLIPSIAFSALSLFSILRYPLDQLADMIAHVQESKVSVDRVEEFLSEEETEKYDQLGTDDGRDSGEIVIGLDNAILTWGSKEAGLGSESSAFRLIEIDVRFHVGRLNVIAGPTGSGKTSLLMALLGEMSLVRGSVHLPGALSREDVKTDRETGLTNNIAYCAQQAWLANATIKDNILFAAPFNKARYRSVIAACALERDLEILDDGDLTLVGEKGIALSGGQKQRISLARALYSSAQHVLLDDCLSAVDSHTAKHIFDCCIMGPLMYGRTCILVTHNITLCIPRSQYVVVMDNGRIASQGRPDEVVASGALGDEIAKSRPGSRGISQIHSRALSAVDLKDRTLLTSKQPQNGNAPDLDKNVVEDPENEKKPKLREETKATGSVNVRVIAMYLAAMGPWHYWLLAFAFFALQQLGSVAANVWIRTWSNSYTRKAEMITEAAIQRSEHHYIHGAGHSLQSFSVAGLSWNMPFVHDISAVDQVASASGSSEAVDDWHYLGIYALLGMFYILVSLLREGYIFWGSLRASKNLHTQLLHAISRAKLQFFDTTPLGQVMNRFSKDIEAIDQDVSPTAVGVLGCLASLISILVLICVITPKFLIAGFFIFLIYFAIGALYLRSSRDLKRLESVNRSPIYQQFGETIAGVVTIRAYGDERRFIRDNQLRVDTQNRPFYYLWATNRWLALRIECVGALVAFFAGVFIILNIGNVDAGSAGLSLTYAVMFTENVLWLVRLYSTNEQNMNSVERVKEYIEVEQEAAAIVEDNRPPSGWPSRGAIEFVKYSTRYRADLEPVLRDLSFTIEPGQRVGVVGRTGAGKSSLALALFRGLEAQSGRIIIDDTDIGGIGLQDLREAITIVPQDPTLFTGTIRSNLDPFSLFTDEEIFAALGRVQLIGPPSPIPPTTSTVSTPSPAQSPLIQIQGDEVGDGRNHASSSTLASTSNHTEPENDHSHDSVSSRPPSQPQSQAQNTNPFLNLSHSIAESGSNLSQGQRQLLCLARALLKAPRVLIMDEATASIDYATDGKIQDTLRQQSDENSVSDRSTVITIAHRLQTIADYDRVLVLEKGKMVEWGPPWELVTKSSEDESAWFRRMCETSGDGDVVVDVAIKAGKKRGWKGRG